MKKDYSAPEFLKIYMVEDVLDISGRDNTKDDELNDNFDPESSDLVVD